jgi:predicted acyltransferase
LAALAGQMQHVTWEGFHFYDLIFPLFMFIAGIAIPLSVRSKLSSKASKNSLVLKAFKRMVLLVLLGFLYNGLFKNGFENARYVSVLGQIGIAYFFASVIVLFSKSFKGILYWLAGILGGVAFLQLFVSVPGIGAGVLTPEGCINGYLDRLLLPGRLAYDSQAAMTAGEGIIDALGLLCIVSAIGITLMGAIAGTILQNAAYTEYRKTGALVIIGLALIVVALLLSPYYPIIKNCWTTTYNLLAGGISFLLIALFYLVIDIWHFQKWSFFFKVIGMNSIFIYLFVRIVPVRNITEFFIGWIISPMGNAGAPISIIGILAGEWLLLYFMYKRNIFVKV